MGRHVFAEAVALCLNVLSEFIICLTCTVRNILVASLCGENTVACTARGKLLRGCHQLTCFRVQIWGKKSNWVWNDCLEASRVAENVRIDTYDIFTNKKKSMKKIPEIKYIFFNSKKNRKKSLKIQKIKIFEKVFFDFRWKFSPFFLESRKNYFFLRFFLSIFLLGKISYRLSYFFPSKFRPLSMSFGEILWLTEDFTRWRCIWRIPS